MTTETDKLVDSFADAFFEHLKHGDAAHQQWLRKETDKFFAAHAPAFRDRIIASLCGDVEPVAEFGGRRQTPEGTTEFWGVLLEPWDAPPKGSQLYSASTVAALKARVAVLEKDAARLNAVQDGSWDLRSFNMPTGQGDADIGWRVIEHYEAAPHEREIAVEYSDNLRKAIDAALTKGQP